MAKKKSIAKSHVVAAARRIMPTQEIIFQFEISNPVLATIYIQHF